MVSPTPKFKSGEFKETVVALKEVFDAHSLGVVLLDALERRAAEQIVARFARGGGGRLQGLQKIDLVGQITGWFFSSDEVAYQVMRELDRACQKERHIIASIPEEQAPERIGSYRAIALKRERAKFVWALARDPRESVRKLASRIINEFFQEVADIERARKISEGEEAPALGDDVELAKRLQAQAERLAEATVEVSDLESRVSSFEEERARLLAEIGAKERAINREHAVREELEQHLKGLRTSLSEVEAKQREAEAAKAAEREARAIADDLAQKVRRLEKLAGAADVLGETQSALDEARKRVDELTRQLARMEQSSHRERSELERERSRLRQDLEASREELRRARKRIAELEPFEREAAARAERSGDDEERLAVLLDQANLAATAAHSYGRKVNFTRVLDTLRAGRKLVAAIAFVVDNGGTAFDAFCDTLRKSGWEVRVKKPKRFHDGTTKADWDMGIAMEAIDVAERADTVVLVTGDGDFAPLVKRLQRHHKKVEVASYADGLAAELASAADTTHRLDTGTLE